VIHLRRPIDRDGSSEAAILRPQMIGVARVNVPARNCCARNTDRSIDECKRSWTQLGVPVVFTSRFSDHSHCEAASELHGPMPGHKSHLVVRLEMSRDTFAGISREEPAVISGL
jgi:hypothetical protein